MVVLANSSGPQVSNGLVPMDSFTPVNRNWRLAVINATTDTILDVLARYQLNGPLSDDHRYFIGTVSIRDTGSQPEVLKATLLFRAIGASGCEYSTFGDFCGDVPDAFLSEQIAPGAARTGNVCWMVAWDDAGSQVMLSTDFAGEYEARSFALYR
jgi:hypothetical protein